MAVRRLKKSTWRIYSVAKKWIYETCAETTLTYTNHKEISSLCPRREPVTFDKCPVRAPPPPLVNNERRRGLAAQGGDSLAISQRAPGNRPHYCAWLLTRYRARAPPLAPRSTLRTDLLPSIFYRVTYSIKRDLLSGRARRFNDLREIRDKVKSTRLNRHCNWLPR